MVKPQRTKSYNFVSSFIRNSAYGALAANPPALVSLQTPMGRCHDCSPEVQIPISGTGGDRSAGKEVGIAAACWRPSGDEDRDPGIHDIRRQHDVGRCTEQAKPATLRHRSLFTGFALTDSI